MSLYYTQKFLYQINRDEPLQKKFLADPDSALQEYDLSDEEITALKTPDIGLLYILGVNGQILMHYAAFHGLEWPQYIQAMRDGLEQHGPVRHGLYVTTDGKGAI